jgi:tetraacyldisaccharide 4'-kinase
MPMGRLRESRYGARRADAVIISKCPDDIDYKMEYYRRKMRKYLKNKDIPVFFTGLKYGNPIDILNPYVQFNETDHILLVTGIANASILKKYLKSNFKLAKHLVFKDHHNYTIEDFAYIYKTYKGINSGNKCIITTQKDMMKWKESDFSRHLSNIPVFYIPIEVYFIEKEKEFMDLVFDKMKQKQDTLRKLHNNEEN